MFSSPVFVSRSNANRSNKLDYTTHYTTPSTNSVSFSSPVFLSRSNANRSNKLNYSTHYTTPSTNLVAFGLPVFVLRSNETDLLILLCFHLLYLLSNAGAESQSLRSCPSSDGRLVYDNSPGPENYVSSFTLHDSNLHPWACVLFRLRDHS